MFDFDLNRLGAWFRNLLIVFGAGTFIYFAETGNDQGLVRSMWADLWAATKTASPLGAMILLLLLIDSVKERREAQRQCNERTIDFVQATNKQASAMEDMAELLKEISHRTQKRRR